MGGYESLKNGNNAHQNEWTQSIAVGSKYFIEETKRKLGILAKGWKVLENGETFQLREQMDTYSVVFNAEKEDIGPQDTYFWKSNSKPSTR